MKLNNTLNNEERRLFTRSLKLNRSDPWIICIEILLRTGMRTEELTKLNKEHINENRNTIFITAAKGSKDRIVPVDKHFTRAILTVFPKSVMETFGMTPKTFKRSLARRFDKFKLVTLGYGFKHLTLHGMRAAFAQAIYENCDNDVMLVKDLLGHKGIQNTMAYVRSLDMEKKFTKIKGAI